MEKKVKQILPRVKAWLLLGKSITQAQCVNMFNGWRLAVYINRLRDEDGPHKMDIDTTMVKGKDGSMYASYSLKKPTFNKNTYKDAIPNHTSR